MAEPVGSGLRERALAAYAQYKRERDAAEAARRQEEHGAQVGYFLRRLGALVEEPMYVNVITSPDGRLHAQIDGVHIGFRVWEETSPYKTHGIYAYVPCGVCAGPAKCRELRPDWVLEDLGAWLAREASGDVPLCKGCYAAKVGEEEVGE